MIYIVLGMHKSGTTLVSQMLHRSGINMGDGFEDGGGYDDGNQWERREAFLINLELCGCSEAGYYSLDHYRGLRRELRDEQISEMKEMIRNCEESGGDWGFKEPLTCLTYPLWKRVLPPHRVVGVYRNPIEVMNHYRVTNRRPAQAWRVLRAWSNYNRGMMEAVREGGRDCLILRYEDLMRSNTDFSRLEEFIGRKLQDVRNPGQYRARAKNPLFEPVERLMGLSPIGRPANLLGELEAMRVETLSSQMVDPMQGQDT